MSTCTIAVSEDEKYIIMKVAGDVKSDDMLQHVVEAHKLARSLNLKRFLLDVTEATNINKVFENYEFVHQKIAQSKDVIRYARVGMLVRKGDHSHDFIETLAQNAGDNVRKFQDIQEVIRFLLE